VYHWAPLATDADEDHSGPTGFLLDNDVDVELLRFIQGAGASAVQLSPAMRTSSDEDVLAEAKRQDRVLITHDRRFVDPQSVEREKNSGVIIIPRDKQGRLDWPLISAILAHIVLSRFVVDQTVWRVFPSWRFTIWNPNEYTDEMEPIFCRVNR